MKRLGQISDVVDKICGVFTTVMLILMTLIMFEQVLARNFFPSHAWSAADTASRYCFIWATFGAAPMVSKRVMQLSVTILPDALKGVWKTILNWINDICFIAVLALMVYWGFYAANLGMRQNVDGLPFPAGVVYLIIPIGFILTIFQIIVVRLMDTFKKKEEETK